MIESLATMTDSQLLSELVTAEQDEAAALATCSESSFPAYEEAVARQVSISAELVRRYDARGAAAFQKVIRSRSTYQKLRQKLFG